MGHSTDAEDGLSRAMLKAWEKVQKYSALEIANFKALLTTLTLNFCLELRSTSDRQHKWALVRSPFLYRGSSVLC
ncbi:MULTISPECIES: hypothetical protein [Aerosakkonema]|uniref:hypothetical protein n=1 Tax=Aerosakkonema TaxID=1246629 RepID=UPI0035BB9402